MNKQFFPTLVALAWLAGALTAPAQSGGPFDWSWNTVDSGGGPSTDGGFSLNGTIGQPDAGAPMSGGIFTVTGGFWPGLAGFPIGPYPGLSIRHGIGNTVVLTWPNPSTGYVLQQTANMSGPGGGWTDVTPTPVIVGVNKEVTLSATGAFCMFRLRRL